MCYLKVLYASITRNIKKGYVFSKFFDGIGTNCVSSFTWYTLD